MRYFVFFLLFSTGLFALENEWRESASGVHIIESYQFDGGWILDEYLVKPGKLQDKVLSKSFSTRYELKKFQQSHYRKLRKIDSSRLKFTSTENRSSKIWAPVNSWNVSWEKAYSSWIKKEFDKDFFVKHNIKTDCADVAFALRWIFARVHSLPAANTLAGSSVLFTHNSMKSEWASKPTAPEWHNDQRFMTALKYILQNTYTKTLYKDTYPVKIGVESFHEGTIHLLGSHTQIISKLDFTGQNAPIWKLQSTVPSMVRVLSEEVMIDAAATDKNLGGIVQMRWPVVQNGKWVLMAKNLMPHYSEEQYEPAFIKDKNNFTLSIIDRLQIPFVPKNIAKNSLESILTSLKERLAIVQEGYSFCLNNNCADGTTNYENYSTPSRDKRLKEKFTTLDELVSTLSQFDLGLKQYVEDLYTKTTLNVEGTIKNLVTYKSLFFHSLPSYHPEDSIAERWALDKDATYSSLYKKFKRLLSIRELLLIEASGCIDNLLCKHGTKNWEKFNTYFFDSKLKKEIYHSYFFLQQYFSGTPSLSLGQDNEIKSIAAILSEPSESYSKRKGQHFLDVTHLGLAKRVIELSEDIFLIDDKIVEIPTNNIKLDNIGNLIFLDDTNHLLYAVKNEVLQVIDGESGNVDVEFVNEFKINELRWLGGQYFVISDCSSYQNLKECHLRILKFELISFQIVADLILDSNSFEMSYETQESFVREKTQMSWLHDKLAHVLYYFDGSKINSLSLIDLDKSINKIYSNKHYLAFHRRDNSSENLNLHLFKKSNNLHCMLHLRKTESLSSISDKGLLGFYKADDKSSSLAQLSDDCSLKRLENFESENIYFLDHASDKSLFFTFESSNSDIAESLELFSYNENGLKNLSYQKEEYILSLDNENLYRYKYAPNLISVSKYNFETETTMQVGASALPLNCLHEIAAYPCPITQNLNSKYSFYFENNELRIAREILNDSNEVILNCFEKPYLGPEEVSQKRIYLKSRRAYSPSENSYIIW